MCGNSTLIRCDNKMPPSNDFFVELTVANHAQCIERGNLSKLRDFRIGKKLYVNWKRVHDIAAL